MKDRGESRSDEALAEVSLEKQIERSYRCTSCGRTFHLARNSHRCPSCEGTLIIVTDRSENGSSKDRGLSRTRTST